MKLIIEQWDGDFYVYHENEKHFSKVEKLRLRRNSKRLSPVILDEECNVRLNFETVKHNNWHMVFNLKK